MSTLRRAAWLSALSRPLASDEHRTRFWVRHIRIGVVLTELAALLVIGYVLAAHRPHPAAVLALGAGLMVGAPALLALPMQRLCRDHRGVLFFYAWSVVTTAVICALVVLDPASATPYAFLLTLTLLYAGMAYPPPGVVLVGAIMVGGYLAAAGAQVDALATGILVLFTVMITWASRNLWDMADQQALLTQRLATLAETDPLTRCLNRRAFEARVQAALATATAERPVSLCLLDLDGFKQVNDRHGHAAGDRVLVATGRALSLATRETDSVSRLGGDEFAVLLPAAGREVALAAAARLQDRLREALCDPGLAAPGVSASIGVTTSDGSTSVHAFVAAADQRMYEAKSSGRDQVRA